MPGTDAIFCGQDGNIVRVTCGALFDGAPAGVCEVYAGFEGNWTLSTRNGGKSPMKPSAFDNFSEAETAVIAWGSNLGVLSETLDRIGSRKLGGLHFDQVFPIRPSVAAMLEGKRVIVVENNHVGQFADLLIRELGIEVDRRITKATGEPFSVEELVEELRTEA
jgi:pyruvate/2-oxoacid:ferredoxin oxidoreductase alpha subunit